MAASRILLLFLACSAGATGAGVAPAPVPTAPNEPIIDAAVLEAVAPAPVKSYSARWPYTVEARFTIDRVGRTQHIVLVPADAPTEIQAAVRSAIARWRFWPALGACRYVEQTASATLVFQEKRVDLDGVAFDPVTARRALPVIDFAWLDPADAGDRRTRPRVAPPKLVDPVALQQTMPRYPAAASRAAQPGHAFVLFEVGADGKIGRVITSDGWASDPKLAPLFAKEAVAAIRQWRFLPATLAGAPQQRLVCQRFLFNMRLGGQ